MAGRVTVTVDGQKFNAIEAVFSMATQNDAAGMPVNQTLTSRLSVWLDVFDDKNIPFSTIQKLFELGNVPDRSKIKDVKVEYWKDDTMQDVISAYKCKAWLGKFEHYNPVLSLPSHPLMQDAAGRSYNQIIHIQFVPVINKENHQEVTISN